MMLISAVGIVKTKHVKKQLYSKSKTEIQDYRIDILGIRI